MLDPELVVELTDLLAMGLCALSGNAELNIGAGHGVPRNNIAGAVPLDEDYGLARAVRRYEKVITATGEWALMDKLARGAHELSKRVGFLQMASDFLHPVIIDLSKTCLIVGIPTIVDLPTFAAYYNTGAGGPYRCLLSEEFADVYEMIYSYRIPAANIYTSPAGRVWWQRSVGGVMVPGQDVDSNRTAGFSRVQMTSSSTAGGGDCRVIGTARTRDGILESGHIWRASIAGDGEAIFEPERPGDLLIAVRDIELPARLTAGTVIVSGMYPSGRMSPAEMR